MMKGRAWVFGDNVDTDAIIPARYLNTSDQAELARHVMEDIDPGFASRVRPGDIIVAGRNFGCGSSREHAPLAIRASGISCVIARSFARIFYRNSINTGLFIVESEEIPDLVQEGDELEINAEAGILVNLSRGTVHRIPEQPAFVREIIEAGGLLPYVRRRLAND